MYVVIIWTHNHEYNIVNNTITKLYTLLRIIFQNNSRLPSINILANQPPPSRSKLSNDKAARAAQYRAIFAKPFFPPPSAYYATIYPRRARHGAIIFTRDPITAFVKVDPINRKRTYIGIYFNIYVRAWYRADI